MRKLIAVFFLFLISFMSYSQGSLAHFNFSIPFGTSGKAVIRFTNGTTDVGVLKDYRTIFDARYADPLEIKFKSNNDEEYKFILSNEIHSVRVHEKKNENAFTDYYPIRVRRFDKKYTFSDKYYVSFYPKTNYKGIDYVTINTFLNGKFKGNSYFFAVGKEEYYFYFDFNYRRTNKESAKFMMLLDQNCESFQDYVKHNYLETSNYKADYKAAVKEFGKIKKAFINQRKAEGYKGYEAKILFKSEEFDIYFKQLMDKYVEFCPKE